MLPLQMEEGFGKIICSLVLFLFIPSLSLFPLLSQSEGSPFN